MKNFRTYELSMQFYKNCQKLKIQGVMKNQFERAVLSIPLNLAEGTAKSSAKERRRYYRTALGSLREVQCMLSILNQAELSSQANHLGAYLYKLCINT